ncbi:MAG: hypothetical protein HOC70_03225 [Gammaproteobacteria bacterium]|jgi:heme a synthase|nr:hypothetical protein [Gammaproteobacteria bacterium]MBT4492228.1 hypothetical protein [Gammaproteobacteria bacterium]MBT7371834.1 hypothetical protein [Gammaproteobacteria bacterium]
MRRTLFLLALVGLVFAVVMSMLSGYIRLGDSGIDCEPWPECFEYSFQLDDEPGVTIGANDPKKGLRVLHRMMASIFGIIALGLVTLALWYRRVQTLGVTCPIVIFVITIILSVVGFYTPDLARPWITTVNLVGGMLLAASLYWYLLNFKERKQGERTTLIALCLVFVSIVTGAWVSANFAATGCDGLFSCRVVDASVEAFNPLRMLNIESGEMITSGQEGIVLLAHQLMGTIAIIIMAYVALVRLKVSSARSLLPLVLTVSLLGVVAAEMVRHSVELASLHNIFALCLLLILIQQYRRWDG